MNTKRIILSLSTLFVTSAFVTSAFVIGATGAFFSDTETSTNNVFTAGSIDLKIDHTSQTYNGVDCQTCSVSVYSSTSTMVVGANATATYSGTYPVNAQLVANPHRNWLSASEVAPAQWIWITPAVDADDTTNGAEYIFEDTFTLQGPISLADFELSIAADNGYKIEVNGTEIVDALAADRVYGAKNPLSAQEQSDFQAALIQNGVNTLRITVRNKIADPDPAANPAGLIYKIDFTNDECEAGVADYQQMCQLWGEKDLANEKFFNFSDVKPQDSGSNVISLHVTSNDAYACLAVTSIEDDENGINRPESDAGDVSDPEGELGTFLMVRGWYSDINGNESSELFPATAAKDLNSITYADSITNTFIAGNTTEYIKLDWCLGDFNSDGSCDGSVPNINQTQTDSLLADLEFHAIQTRNNDDFVCGGIESIVLENNDTPGTGAGDSSPGQV